MYAWLTLVNPVKHFGIAKTLQLLFGTTTTTNYYCTMATRTGQKNQNQWMEDEVEDLKVLMDKLGRSLPMGKLKALLVLEEPKEAYPPFKRLIEGQGNGGTPRTLSGLQSKAKKLALEQKEEKGEKYQLWPDFLSSPKDFPSNHQLRIWFLLLQRPSP